MFMLRVACCVFRVPFSRTTHHAPRITLSPFRSRSAPPPMSRLLIIEDELPMRTALQDCLQSEGYRVLTAADGESGLRRALEEQPDLILLDIMMPRLDGFAVCAELRRLNNAVPILMLTAKGQV